MATSAHIAAGPPAGGLHSRVARAGRWASRVAAAALPALAVVAIVRLTFGAWPSAYVPDQLNDQVSYWHKILSFSRVGFDPGFYSFDEVSPPTDAGRYGVNGPYFPAIYGALAHLTGWRAATFVWFNLAFLTASLAIWQWLVKPRRRDAWTAALVVIATWPVVFYALSSMQEAFQQSIGIVLAGVLWRAVDRGPSLARRERALSIGVVVAAAILRSSWGVLLVPLIVLHGSRFTVRRTVAAVAAGGAAMGASMAIVARLQPPGFNSILDRGASIGRSPWQGARDVLDIGLANARDFARVDSLTIDGGLQNLQVALFTGGALWVVVAWWLTRRSPARPSLRAPSTRAVREAVFHVLNLGSIVIASWFAYLPSGYWRLLGAHLLVSGLVLVAARRGEAVRMLLVTSLFVLPAFHALFVQVHSSGFDHDTVEYREAVRANRHAVRYDRDASSPWCNTLLLPIAAYDWRVTTVPAGIGIAASFAPELPVSPRSRYVLVPPGTSAPGAAAWDEIASSAAGRTYINPSTTCR